MNDILKIEKLSFAYGKKKILDALDLEVKKGDFLGIIGPNGSGKSTLLKLILGSLRPHAGKIHLFNTQIENFKDWHKVGYLSQKATAFNSGFPATVEEVVATGLYDKKNTFIPLRKIDWKGIEMVLHQVGLDDFRKARVGALSGGQQQRVFLARTLLKNPQVIFLDEPTVGLDAEGYHKFAQLLSTLNKKTGITVVVVTHQISCMIHHFSRIAYLNQGKITTYLPEQFIQECQYI